MTPDTPARAQIDIDDFRVEEADDAPAALVQSTAIEPAPSADAD